MKKKSKHNGWTVTYVPLHDLFGNRQVAGRFKTEQERDRFLEKIKNYDSEWTEQELMSLDVHPGYNYNPGHY